MADPINPDLSALAQPGPQAAGPMPTPVQPTSQIPNATAPPNVTPAPETGINPTQPPAPPKGGTPVGTPNVGRHQGLVNMVQGLITGLSAAGKSMATGGREGGVQEVQAIRGEAQRQQIQKTEAEQQAKTETIRQQLLSGQLNQVLMQNSLALATIPDKTTQEHVATISVTQQARTQAYQDFLQTGDWDAYQTTLQKLGGTPPAAPTGAAPAVPTAGAPAVTPNVLPGVTPGAPAAPGATPAAGIPSAIPAVAVSTWKKPVDEAVASYANDQAIKDAAAQFDTASKLTDPKQAAIQMRQASIVAANRQAVLDAAGTSRQKQETLAAGSPVAKLSTPEALAAPGSQAAIQAKIDDPNTDSNDVPRLQALLPQAAVAQFNAENIKAREARNQQIVNQGSPDDAGKLLANRSLTLSELKSRQVTPAFIAEAVKAAQKYDPNYKAADADAQAKIAGSAANQQFFGNTDSLLVKGGTLDQLDKTYDALGNTQIPIINKIENLRKAAVGSGPLAAAYAAQLGVADDGSKVMTGGVGSDTSRQQFLDIINANLSPEGRKAAIAQIRAQITSQRNGRVGTNPYMKDMYPDPSTRQEAPGLAGTQPAAPRIPPAGVPAGSKLMQVPGGLPHWMSPDKIAAAQKLGATEVR